LNVGGLLVCNKNTDQCACRAKLGTLNCAQFGDVPEILEVRYEPTFNVDEILISGTQGAAFENHGYYMIVTPLGYQYSKMDVTQVYLTLTYTLPKPLVLDGAPESARRIGGIVRQPGALQPQLLAPIIGQQNQ
jgi:hypothetical protein